MTCDKRYPGGFSTRCVLEATNHQWCLGWSDSAGEMIDWANPDYVPSKRVDQSTARTRIARMADRVTPARTVRDGR